MYLTGHITRFLKNGNTFIGKHISSTALVYAI